MATLADYTGREQAYVKHVFLERYLERLVHKTASRYPHIVYVDGFAGPWQSKNERFEDTSFGIALNALRRAKASWKDLGRDVTMSAFLVEQEADAYSQLAKVPDRYPDLRVKTYRSDFLSTSGKILQDIPADAFAFFFLDPKGWRIPLRSLELLFSRPNSEVIFNFMFDFINRAASIEDPAIVTGLDELIPNKNWRQAFGASRRAHYGELTSEERKSILVNAFSDSLSELGRYSYVAETTVLRPVKDRPLYCLFYATRHRAGIEVFRDSQAEALKEQSKMRATSKIRHIESKTGQTEFFQSLHEMAPDELDQFSQIERLAAERALLELTPASPGFILYEELWPQVLSRHVVRRTDVNQIAASLRKNGLLTMPDWESRRRVPQGNYRVQRGSLL